MSSQRFGQKRLLPTSLERLYRRARRALRFPQISFSKKCSRSSLADLSEMNVVIDLIKQSFRSGQMLMCVSEFFQSEEQAAKVQINHSLIASVTGSLEMKAGRGIFDQCSIEKALVPFAELSEQDSELVMEGSFESVVLT